MPETKREPLEMSPLPKAELPMGQYILVLVLVLVDDYSRFSIFEVVSSTSANVVIPCIEKVFSEYGIPDALRTDNGPSFNSRDLTQFAEQLGFLHRKITPN